MRDRADAREGVLTEGLLDGLRRVRRTYHFHLPGVVYAVTTIFLAIGAINSQNNLLFWAFGLAVSGMLVSGVISGASLMGVQVRREPIEPAHAGGVLHIRYTVRNANRVFPAFAINLSELHSDRSDTDPKTRGNWFERITEPFAFVPLVRAGEAVIVVASVRPLVRGEIRFSALSAWTVFPFGLTRKSVTFNGPRSVVVRPEILTLDAKELSGLLACANGTRSIAKRAHDGTEFFALREYTPGDSQRSIAWRRSARTGETIVRQHSAMTASQVLIAVELNHHAAAGEHAISRAASLILEFAKRSSAVGLVLNSPVVRVLPREGRGHVEAMLDTLAVIPAVASADQGAPGDDARLGIERAAESVLRVRAVDFLPRPDTILETRLTSRATPRASSGRSASSGRVG